VSKSASILHLIETTGPGGAETVLLNVACRLDPAVFHSTVVVTGPGWLYDRLIEAGIETLILPSTGANDVGFLRGLNRIVREKRIDLVHSHLAGMNFYASLAGRLTGRPVVATYHGMLGDWTRKTLKNRLKYAVIRRCTYRIVAVSDFLRTKLISTWSFPDKKVALIYNGVDFEEFEKVYPRRTLKDELSLPPDSLLVGMVGNIRPAKGHEFFVRAARLIVDRIPNCRFLIVGQGEGKLLDDLKQQIDQLKLRESVHLVGFREDIPFVLSQLDVFVLSSITEGLSIATIEAMALARPVVVTDSGGPAEIVEDGRTGFLTPPADPRAMAEKVVQLLNDHEMARRVGEEGRTSVRRRFGIKQNIQAYEALYRRCLNRSETD
jgi:glycosyltransferase involved in cell wall biosynthesis